MLVTWKLIIKTNNNLDELSTTQNYEELIMITQVQQKAWETLYNPHDAGYQLLSQKSAHILSRKELKQAFQTMEATCEAGSDHPAEISTKN